MRERFGNGPKAEPESEAERSSTGYRTELVRRVGREFQHATRACHLHPNGASESRQKPACRSLKRTLAAPSSPESFSRRSRDCLGKPAQAAFRRSARAYRGRVTALCAVSI